MTDAEFLRSQKDFAAALTELRLRSGLTVRAVAKRTELPVSTLGGYFSGRHLPPPSRPELLGQLLDALSVPPDERDLWQTAVRRLAKRGSGLAEASPYPGLRSFAVHESQDFHGRDALVAQLVATVAGSAGHVVAVVGASGAGKSSLLRAGLVPAMGGWTVRFVDLGEDVVGAVEDAVAGREGPGPECLVLDPANDLWVRADEPGRRRALDALAGWVSSEGRTRVVVVGLRSDYYAAGAADPVLLPALQDRCVLVGPMSDSELVEAVERPALRVRGSLETGLVELMIRDARTRSPAGSDPALPQLSHCLATMWSTSPEPGRMTIANYLGTGGIAGSVAATAEAAYGELAEEDRPRAQSLLLRLVAVEDGLPPAGVPLPLSDVDDADAALVELFADHRLITVDRDTARLSHEVVIDAWPRLRSWIDASEAMLLRHRLVARETAGWLAADRDPDLLMRGTRLMEAQLLAAPDAPVVLSAGERSFLAASSEREVARSAVEQARQRRQRLLLVATSSLLVMAVVAAVSYVRLSRDLTAERDAARSRSLAFSARGLAQTNPPLAHLAAVAAYKTSPTIEARSALLDATADPSVTRLVGPVGDRRIAAAPQRHLLAVAGGLPSITFYDTSAPVPREVSSLPAPLSKTPGSAVFGVAFSEDGRLVALGGDAGKVRLLDLADPVHPRQVGDDLAVHGTVYSIAFHSGMLYAGTSKGGVERWDLGASGTTPRQLPALPTDGAVLSLSVAPGGSVAAGTDGGRTDVWWAANGSLLPRVSIDGGPLPISSVLVSDDSLLAGSHDGTLKRWPRPARPASSVSVMAAGAGTTLATFPSWVNAIAYAGGALVAGSSDGSVRTWRGPADTEGVPMVLGAAVDTIAAVDDHRVAVGIGGQIDLVDLRRMELWPGPGGVFGLTFIGDGRQLAAAAGHTDQWHVYDTTDPQAPVQVGGPVPGDFAKSILVGTVAATPDGKTVVVGHRDGTLDGVDVATRRVAFRIAGNGVLGESLAISPDGRFLALGADENAVRLFDLTKNPPTELAPLVGASNHVLGVAFSPDGRLLAGASLDNATYLWGRASSSSRDWSLVAKIPSKGFAYAAAFSPDGKTLATAGADSGVHLWQISDPAHPISGGDLNGPSGDVYQVAFSRSGALAAVSGDKSVTVWDPASSAGGASAGYQKVAVLTGLGQVGFSLVWSPDGVSLVAGGANGALRVWQTDPMKAMAGICRSAGSPLSSAEWSVLAPDQVEPKIC